MFFHGFPVMGLLMALLMALQMPRGGGHPESSCSGYGTIEYTQMVPWQAPPYWLGLPSGELT